MFCGKCGTELPDFAKFCGKCGEKILVPEKDDTTVLLDDFPTQTSVSNPTGIIDKSHVAIAGDSAAVPSTVPLVQDITPRGFSSKKHLIILALGVVLAIVIAIVGINVGVSHSHSQSVARGFEIAERYLSELNYEQAVIEFRNILEIEPMNVEAYLGLAESYVGIGKTNKAIKILKKGYDLTGDERLQDMIDELERGDVSIVSSSANVDPTEPEEVEKSEKYKYIDVSEYFTPSDILTVIADGKIINAQNEDEHGFFNVYKSVFVSDDLSLTLQNEIFSSGLYSAEGGNIVSWETPEKVHNGETHHVYKATSEGTKVVMTSPYPLYVTQEGYIAYYSSRNDSYVTVNIQSPSGDLIGSISIKGYSAPIDYIYGNVKDRLSLGEDCFFCAKSNGALFVYALEQSSSKDSQYLFYSDGEISFDEHIREYTSTGKIQYSVKNLSYSDITYLPISKVVYVGEEGSSEIIEYYQDGHEPGFGLDSYDIDPKYNAYALVNTKNGMYSKLYKEVSDAGNGLYIATDFEGKKCYIDENGIEVSSKYDDVGCFVGGEYSCVLEDGTYYLINSNLELVTHIIGTSVSAIGYNMFSCVNEGKIYILYIK